MSKHPENFKLTEIINILRESGYDARHITGPLPEPPAADTGQEGADG